MRRVLVYLVAMFPPAVTVPGAIAHFLAIDWGMRAVSGLPLTLSWRSLVGALTVLLFMLLMRVQDELKDVETDLKLGRAGDPRYKDRPIVTGAVKVEDIHALRKVTLVALVVVNLPWLFLQRVLPVVAFSSTLVVVSASYVWFFYPKMKENLLLAFATHNPITLLISSTVVATSIVGGSTWSPWIAALVLMIWLPVAAWEVARKVRLPGDETEYTTYSKVLGWRVATVVPALFVIGAAIGEGALARAVGLGVAFFAVLGVAAVVPVLGAAQLLVRPTSRGASRLRPLVELFAGVSLMGFVIALGVSRGVAFESH